MEEAPSSVRRWGDAEENVDKYLCCGFRGKKREKQSKQVEGWIVWIFPWALVAWYLTVDVWGREIVAWTGRSLWKPDEWDGWGVGSEFPGLHVKGAEAGELFSL